MDNNIITPDYFNKIEEKCLQVGMKKETFLKEASFAVQLFNKNSYLNSATPESKLKCVYNVALTGLTLNPTMKLAYLIPRYSSQLKAVEACLEPSYIGLLKLITDTGSVNSITCHVVYEGDTFSIDIAQNNISHVPHSFTGKDKGTIIGAYCISHLMTGGNQVEWMTIDELYTIRERSESYISYLSGKSKSCIWISDETEMFRKTVIKRATKYLPRTENWEKLQEAIEIDNSDFKATDSQINYIEKLLLSCSLEVEQVIEIEREMPILTAQRAGEIIDNLKQNQLDPITQMGRYSQTDIVNKIKEITK